MKVPLQWLKDFVDVKIRPEELAERLTLAGLEIGAIEYHGSGVSGVVVGKVKSVEKLPSDHHLVCQVDIGLKIVQVITEDMTIRSGEKVPIALEGATIASGLKVKKTEMHGVEAFGYLCRPHELGMGQEETVLRLPLDAKLGEDIKKYLGSGGCVIDVDVLPNRGDCLSILGVAREVAAVLKSKLKSQKSKVQVKSQKVKGAAIKVEIKDYKLCPRYMARVIEGVKVGESPEWMKDRLLLAGMRPINNIVDATNYLLLELGQPMHAFDGEKIEGGKIIVRKAKAGEKLITLDGVERKLNAENLVIADEERAIALAGVMGGGNSEVTEKTTTVVLESAYFDPISIIKTSKDVKLRTEASIRFEKGVDWKMVESALDAAAQMIAENSGGTVAPVKIDIKDKARKETTLVLRQDYMDKILGIHIPLKEAAAMLGRLGIRKLKVDSPSTSLGTSRKLKVGIPFWRAGDIEREADLIEEVARLNGYDRIQTTIPMIKRREVQEDLSYDLSRRVREVLVGCGYYETQTFSLVDPKMADPKAIKITNPLSIEESVMRTELLPSLLKVVSHNLRHQVNDIRIFEINKIFLPQEKLVLAGAVVGEGEDLYSLKNAIENVLSEFGIIREYESLMGHNFCPGRAAAILAGSKKIVLGKYGELEPAFLAKWDIKRPVFVFELELEPLIKEMKKARKYRSLPKFPKMERDLSMLVPEGVSSKSIISLIKQTAGELLEEVYLFDRFKDSQAYRMAFRDPERTLTDDVVNQKFDAIQKLLAEKLKVTIRK